MNLVDAVAAVDFPSKGDPYFAFTSVDGYAFLGAAKALIGLDYSRELSVVTDGRPFGLRAPYKVLSKRLTADTIYTYSCWPVWEFAQAAQSDELKQRVGTELSRISLYGGGGVEAGAIEYVSEGCDYLVPNVQALAALMLPQHRTSLLEWLVRNQTAAGNWHYGIISKQKKARQEDVFHLAFIAYVLRQLRDCESILNKSLGCIYRETRTTIPGGTIGWGPPMVLQAVRGLSPELEARARAASLSLLQDESANFRARAFAAWALACDGLT